MSTIECSKCMCFHYLFFDPMKWGRKHSTWVEFINLLDHQQWEKIIVVVFVPVLKERNVVLRGHNKT